MNIFRVHKKVKKSRRSWLTVSLCLISLLWSFWSTLCWRPRLKHIWSMGSPEPLIRQNISRRMSLSAKLAYSMTSRKKSWSKDAWSVLRLVAGPTTMRSQSKIEFRNSLTNQSQLLTFTDNLAKSEQLTPEVALEKFMLPLSKLWCLRPCSWSDQKLLERPRSERNLLQGPICPWSTSMSLCKPRVSKIPTTKQLFLASFNASAQRPSPVLF